MLHKKDVALKVEKNDKNKQILKFEYDVLRNLQNFSICPKVYDFIENSYSNFIEMELLGKNVTNFKKGKGNSFTNVMAYEILIQMLDCIEVVHDKGFIHRDIKPSNFVLCQEEKKVFIVDFGLAKLHLNKKRIGCSSQEDRGLPWDSCLRFDERP